MKKSIVLLITLFFISAISILILQNLKDSEEFLNVVDFDTKLSQTKISIQNLNSEVMKFFKTNNNIDEIIKQLPIDLPLTLDKNVDLIIHIEQYFPEDYISLNDINQSNLPDEFNANIDYKYTFFQILNKNKKILEAPHKITNQKQVDFIINQYITQTKDDRILNIKDKFSYGKFDNNESSIYLKCKYNINLKDIKSQIDLIFKVGELSPTQFEFNFLYNGV